MRFENEVKYLKEHGFVIIRLNVPDNIRIERIKSTYPNNYTEHIEGMNHNSENDIANLEVDLDLNFQLDKGNFTTRKNYVLDLNKDYSLLYKGYKKDRRKSLRKAEEANIEYKDFNNKKVLIKLYKQEFSHLNISEKYFQVVDKIIDYALENKIGFVRNIFYSEDLICSGFFLSYNKKIYYFFGASNKKGKQLGATTFLIDSVIKEFSDTITTFDFEGSSVSNVASFYKSFGSSQIDYYRFSANAIKRAFF